MKKIVVTWVVVFFAAIISTGCESAYGSELDEISGLTCKYVELITQGKRVEAAEVRAKITALDESLKKKYPSEEDRKKIQDAIDQAGKDCLKKLGY